MADNVVDFPGITRLDLPVEKILGRALEAGLDSVVVVGRDADGDFYGACSSADSAEVHYLLSLGAHNMLLGEPDDDDV